jgi:hypothetical protein
LPVFASCRNSSRPNGSSLFSNSTGPLRAALFFDLLGGQQPKYETAEDIINTQSRKDEE